MAYVQRDGADESLWIRQTGAASNVQIVAARPGVRIAGVTVTPDGTFVDYLTLESLPNVVLTLWRVPFLGGTPRRLIDDVHSPVAWSPDGKQMSFTRGDLEYSHTSIVIADAEGRNERTLAMREGSELGFFTIRNPGGDYTRLSWSPDGKVIAVPGWGFPGGVLTGFMLFVGVSDGSVEAKSITPPGAGVWFDNTSLLYSRSLGQRSPQQLWRLAYPSGDLSRLTNDLSTYRGVSLTADRDAFAVARTEDQVDIWIGDSAATSGRDVAPAVQPMMANGSSLAWAPDRLIFTARTSTGTGLSQLTPENAASDQVLADADAPSVSADGRTLVYLSRASETLNTLWRTDPNGGRPTRIAGTADWPVTHTRRSFGDLHRADQRRPATAVDRSHRRRHTVAAHRPRGLYAGRIARWEVAGLRVGRRQEPNDDRRLRPAGMHNAETPDPAWACDRARCRRPASVDDGQRWYRVRQHAITAEPVGAAGQRRAAASIEPLRRRSSDSRFRLVARRCTPRNRTRQDDHRYRPVSRCARSTFKLVTVCQPRRIFEASKRI